MTGVYNIIKFKGKFLFKSSEFCKIENAILVSFSGKRIIFHLSENLKNGIDRGIGSNYN
jgi:hypothetical protein